MNYWKKTFAVLLMMLMILFVPALPALAANDHSDRVVDNAGLMSDTEVARLMERLDSISESLGMDVCVVTVDDFTQNSVMEAADDFYDYNGYGLGADYSGLMLYISMAERDWYITTCGEAIRIFSDADIQSIGDSIVSDLGSGYYYDAFVTFADLCEDEIKDETTYHWFRYLVRGLIAGFIIAFIYVSSLKSKLKSVAPKNEAMDYVMKNSLHVTNSNELFLYKTMSVTRRESSSSGGSSTHTSSSGRSHGGGGGKF